MRVPAKCYRSKRRKQVILPNKGMFRKVLTVEATFDLDLNGWAVSPAKKKGHGYVCTSLE